MENISTNKDYVGYVDFGFKTFEINICASDRTDISVVEIESIVIVFVEVLWEHGKVSVAILHVGDKTNKLAGKVNLIELYGGIGFGFWRVRVIVLG